MNKFLKRMVVFVFTATAVSTNANAQSRLQADIDAGAIPLTTSELTSVFVNNTMVGPNWYIYQSEDKKKIVLAGGKTYKRKWWIDNKKGFCSTTVKKKTVCRIVYRIGEDEYRVYDQKGKETSTFRVEKGNIKDLN